MENLKAKIKNLKGKILDKILFPKKDVYVDSLGICCVEGKDAEILWKYRKPKIMEERDEFYIDRFTSIGLMSYNLKFDFENKKVIKIVKPTYLGLSLMSR